MRLEWLLLATLLASVSDAAAQSNFALCRDAMPGCDEASLSDEEARHVDAVRSGRNFSNCFHKLPACEVMKLTADQVTTLARISEEQRLKAVLLSARNFSACAHGEATCDQFALTPDQIATLHRIKAEQQARSSAAPLLSYAAPGQTRSHSQDSIEPSQQQVASVPKPLPQEILAAQAVREPPATHASPRDTEPPSPSGPGRERWRKFGVGLLEALGAIATAYVQVEAQKAATEPIVVSGGYGTVVVPTGSAVVAPASSFVESRIDGAFEGWTGETIFKLLNGQIWQQTQYAYRYHYAFQPRVYIYRSGSTYRMQVEGISESIAVARLR